MDRILLNSTIKRLSTDYGFTTSKIKHYYSLLSNYPFVTEDNDEKALECLEMVVQDRISNTVENEISQLKRSVHDSVEEALYRIYEEKSIGFLSEQFIKTREIEKENNNVLSKCMECSYIENVYNGYI